MKFPSILDGEPMSAMSSMWIMPYRFLYSFSLPPPGGTTSANALVVHVTHPDERKAGGVPDPILP
ncbi:MAG TPA: hypothetical protein VED17_06585 [Nitrososphaerales archaeon]|nr:hypothetical protein [Nitrososphaerales archaeon]